jgi:hypothetical protein
LSYQDGTQAPATQEKSSAGCEVPVIVERERLSAKFERLSGGRFLQFWYSFPTKIDLFFRKQTYFWASTSIFPKMDLNWPKQT